MCDSPHHAGLVRVRPQEEQVSSPFPDGGRCVHPRAPELLSFDCDHASLGLIDREHVGAGALQVPLYFDLIGEAEVSAGVSLFHGSALTGSGTDDDSRCLFFELFE